MAIGGYFQIPRIPPPSEPVRYRQREDDRHEFRGSSVKSNQSHISSHSDWVGDQGSLHPSIASGSVLSEHNTRCSDPVGTPGSFSQSLESCSEHFSISKDHAGSQSSMRHSIESNFLQPSAGPVSIKSENSSFKSAVVSSCSVYSEFNDYSLPSASQLFALSTDPLLPSQPVPPKQTSPRHVTVTDSYFAVTDDTSKHSIIFDQTIFDQVNILRDTLKSPTPCSSKTEDSWNDVISEQTTSPQTVIIRSPSSEVSNVVSEHSNPFLQPGLSGSEGIQLIQEPIQVEDINLGISKLQEENQQTVSHDTNMISDSGKELGEPSAQLGISDTQLGDTKFDEENQLTVIPATNPFGSKMTSQSGTPLEDLFKPEEEIVPRNQSYEVVNTGSCEQVQPRPSQSGELDMFTNLFQDEETQ